MLLELDFSSEIPIYLQIRNQIVLGIAKGVLAPGQKLPTIRNLADEVGINMMTVNKAYQQLKQEGYISADRRSGAVVSSQIPAAGALSQKLQRELSLIISEAKLCGVSKEDILSLCNNIYNKMGEQL